MRRLAVTDWKGLKALVNCESFFETPIDIQGRNRPTP